MKSDHEIARSVKLIPIDEITKRLFIPPEVVAAINRFDDDRDSELTEGMDG